MSTVKDPAKLPARTTHISVGTIFLLCLGYNLWAVSIGWWNSILGWHAMRQCQTALSVYWLLHGGSWVAYETPVLGAPWSLPLEFPLYQWTVAVAVKLFSTPLDQTGRMISLLYFYLTFAPAYYLLRQLRVRRCYTLVFFAMLLVSPQYVFWSRTFMIESAALFLAMCYLAGVARYLESRGRLAAVFAAVSGMLAGAVKVTTFVPFCIASAPLVLARARRFRFQPSDIARVAVPFFVIPASGTLAWTYYAEAQRAANPLAGFLTSLGLTSWFFGTVAQRINGELWHALVNDTIPDAIGNCWVWVGGMIALCIAPQRWRHACVCLALFASSELIFSNLWINHNYYAYANSLFLVAALGFAVVSLLERPDRRRYLGLALFVSATIVAANAHYRRCFLAQEQNVTSALALDLKAMTQPDDVLLVYGLDWDSKLPYYANRRALMDPGNRAFDKPEMRAALDNLKGYHVGAAVFCNDARAMPALIGQAQRAFHLRPSGLPGDCDVYLAAARDPTDSP